MTTNIKTTYCEVCKTAITYATKKPTRCKNCKTAKASAAFKGSSKQETQVLYAMHEIVQPAEYVINGFHSWLPSPKGAPMQLDFYCPTFKLAVEVQGIQHTRYVSYFHKTRKDYEYQCRCDRLKFKLCIQRGITLVYVPYDYKVNTESILKLIEQYNPPLYRKLKHME
jgi:hypothetical protein